MFKHLNQMLLLMIRKIIIEFDEGSDFHSNQNNLNYVKKYLNYNRLLTTKINNFNPVVLRITYPTNYNTDIYNEEHMNNEYNGYFDKLVKHVIKSILNDNKLNYCYVLVKYKNTYMNNIINNSNVKDNKIIMNVVETDVIKENINDSAIVLYEKGYPYDTITYEEYEYKLKGGEIFKIKYKHPTNLREIIAHDLYSENPNLTLLSAITYEVCEPYFNKEYVKKYSKYYDILAHEYYEPFFNGAEKDCCTERDVRQFDIKFRKCFYYEFSKLPDKESKRIYMSLLVLMCIFLHDKDHMGIYGKNIYSEYLINFITKHYIYVTPELINSCNILNDYVKKNHLEQKINDEWK